MKAHSKGSAADVGDKEKLSPKHGDEGGDDNTIAASSHVVASFPWYSRKRLRHFTSQTKFHNTIIGLVIFDLMLVFIELIVAILSSCTPASPEGEGGVAEGTREDGADPGSAAVASALAGASCTPSITESPALETAKIALFGISVAILCIFTIEILVSLYCKGFRVFCKSIVAVIDAIIVISSLGMELGFKFSGLESSQSAGGAIVILRVWKIVRAMHAVAHSIQMRNQHAINAVRNAMRLSNNLTAELVKGYSIERRRYLTLQSKLLEVSAQPVVDIAVLSELATEMGTVFKPVDEKLFSIRSAIQDAQREELDELLNALAVSPEEVEDGDEESTGATVGGRKGDEEV